MARITGRTVLIVGASSGIGAQVARQLADGGNRFVLTARRAPELASVAKERSPFRAALTPEQQVLEGQLVAMALDTVTGS
ncbi:SDR family NAD(P)-dependent oxidoreductase [Streptomyces sp. NBC_00005]|uniref:SDR family NAD(P)-dependent oxidoreductase n=1 Tax=Streptomyces sp. NBC_00005 TaxID=2903609 RepID=UPI003246B511